MGRYNLMMVAMSTLVLVHHAACEFEKLTPSNFETKLEAAGNKVVVLYFTATWCGACEKIAQQVEKLAVESPGVIFYKVDVDECEDIAANYVVSALPKFVIIRESVEKSRTKGDMSALKKEIVAVLAAKNTEDHEAAIKQRFSRYSKLDALSKGNE